MKIAGVFRIFFVLALFSVCAALNGAAKYALVIGNGNYKTVAKLANPANDASDVKNVLQSIGFEVNLLLDANLEQMEEAALQLKEKLSRSKDSYGFFFYAGHGVQAQGQNYLIPVDAVVRAENFLKTKAFNVQVLLDELEDAKNILNIIVLDACRDNPFNWSRGSSMGLAAVNNIPAGSIVVFATSAGKTAADGVGRNGLFTAELLKNLGAPDVEVKEVFSRTGAGVLLASGGSQYPELSIKFFGRAYLNGQARESGGGAPEINKDALSILNDTWSGTVVYEKDGRRFRDFYEIVFLEDGSCDIQVRTKMEDYEVYQFGSGYWSMEGGVLRIDCDFFNPIIERLDSLKWEGRYTVSGGGRRLSFTVKPAPDAERDVTLTLNRKK